MLKFEGSFIKISKLCVCIKGRILQLYTVQNFEVKFYKEINLPELCIQMVKNDLKFPQNIIFKIIKLKKVNCTNVKIAHAQPQS